jgi:dTMP kinase
MLIVFEGIDGCGKSTAMESVAGALAEYGIDALITSEFGPHMPWGPGLKQELLNVAGDPQDEYDVVRTARRFHAWEVLEPALAAGRVVLMDRYLWSTCAYQGQTPALTVKRILEEHQADDLPVADLTIYLACPLHIAKKRARGRGRGDAFDQRGIDFFAQAASVFDGLYATVARHNLHSVVRIDAASPANRVNKLAFDEAIGMIMRRKIETKLERFG